MLSSNEMENLGTVEHSGPDAVRRRSSTGEASLSAWDESGVLILGCDRDVGLKKMKWSE